MPAIAILQEDDEGGRVLGAAHRLEPAERAFGGAELLEGGEGRAALEQEGDGEHRISDHRRHRMLGLEHVDHALVDRDSGAQGKYQNGDDEAPEIELAPVAERVVFVGGLARLAPAPDQEQLVQAVDDAVDPLGQHRRRAGHRRRREFRDRDAEIRREGDQQGAVVMGRATHRRRALPATAPDR
jgi:hypothetical protein